MTFTIDLANDPIIKQLLETVQQQSEKIKALEAALPEWVHQVEAERLTGLSYSTLLRERNKPNSLIVWKSDRGVHFLRSSLLAHNTRRTVVRGSKPIV